jgi:hypothetical protein
MPKQSFVFETAEEKHLPSSVTDPQKRLEDSYKVVYFVAGLNVVFGSIAYLFNPEFLQGFGFSIISIFCGLISLPLGFFVHRESTYALILAVGIFIVDTVSSFYLAVSLGYEKSVIVTTIVRYGLLTSMWQGFGAIKALKTKDTEVRHPLQTVEPLDTRKNQPKKQSILVKILLFAVLTPMALFYLVLLVGSTYEAIVFPQFPQKVTLAQAVEMDLKNEPAFLFFEKSLYLSITDAVWECASIKQQGKLTEESDSRNTDAVFTDTKKTALVFVEVEGHYNCQELQEKEIAGELQHVTQRPVEYQSDASGLVTIDEDSEITTLSLCTHCTPSEARLYPIFFLLFPFVMWGILEFGKRQQKKQNSR